MVLMVFLFMIEGRQQAINYLDSRSFTEPMFVLVIMVVSASRPILEFAGRAVRFAARCLPLPWGMAVYLVVLSLVPLLGSFITEPAAMTLAALMLRDTLFSQPVSGRVKYATLGVLFVNISIGGTLMPFAAPPVLMVAAKWNWGYWFMISNFGWKAAVAVVFNAAAAALLFRNELTTVAAAAQQPAKPVPAPLVILHLAFLVLVVVFAHHLSVFIPLFVLFMGVVSAYRHHQSPLILREGLLVGIFLTGLVVLGGKQQWWLQPLLMGMDEKVVFFGATILTAVTDNAALTYLGSLVEGLGQGFKIALVAGAVTGGGLTIIANAPNPAGVAILREKFPEGTIQPLSLLIAALPPTLTSLLAFHVL